MNRTNYSRPPTRRVGSSAPATLFRQRSRGRVAIPVVVVLAGLIIVPAALGSATDDVEPPPAAPAAAPAAARGEAPGQVVDAAGVSAPAPKTVPFATFEDLTLRLPAEEVLLVGYHEASFDDARALVPHGDALANDNRTKFVPEDEDAAGPEYVVLSSRGRPRPATSAVDIVLDDGTEVLSPVTGTVVAVEPYLLYGEHEDTRIEIVPDGRPDLSLVMIHVEGVAVAVGDHVDAGLTPVAAGPNRFPFGSQIDRFFDPDRWPHVHIEVKRR